MTTFDELEARVMYDLDQTDDPDELVALLAAPESRWYARARLASLAVKGMVADSWNPLLHPRGRDGRFIKVFGWIRWLDFDSDTPGWKRGQVTSIDPTTGTAHVVTDDISLDLTPSILKSQVYTVPTPKASLKLPDPKAHTDAPGFLQTSGKGGSNPGAMFTLESQAGNESQLKLDTIGIAPELIKKYGLSVTKHTKSGHTIGFSSVKKKIFLAEDGTLLLVGNSNPVGGGWPTYTDVNGDTGQLTPEMLGDEWRSFTLGNDSKPSDAARLWGELVAQASLLAEGQKVYVKTAKSKEHARNEVLANRLYELAGVNVAETFMGDDGITIGSRLIPTTVSKTDIGANLGDEEVMSLMRSDMVIDAWLANWDVVGLGLENTQVVDGHPYRIDAGGALLYRAQGAPKGHLFGPEVGELETLKNGMNPQAAQVFGKVTDAELKDGATRLAAIDPETIKAYVEAAEMDPSLGDTLVARRADILFKVGVEDPYQEVDPAQPFMDELPTAEELYKAEQELIEKMSGEPVETPTFTPDDDDLEAAKLALLTAPTIQTKWPDEVGVGSYLIYDKDLWQISDIAPGGVDAKTWGLHWTISNVVSGEAKTINWSEAAAAPDSNFVLTTDNDDFAAEWVQLFSPDADSPVSDDGGDGDFVPPADISVVFPEPDPIPEDMVPPPVADGDGPLGLPADGTLTWTGAILLTPFTVFKEWNDKWGDPTPTEEPIPQTWGEYYADVSGLIEGADVPWTDKVEALDYLVNNAKSYVEPKLAKPDPAATPDIGPSSDPVAPSDHKMINGDLHLGDSYDLKAMYADNPSVAETVMKTLVGQVIVTHSADTDLLDVTDNGVDPPFVNVDLYTKDRVAVVEGITDYEYGIPTLKVRFADGTPATLTHDWLHNKKVTVVNNITVDDFKLSSKITIKQDGTLTRNGHVIGEWAEKGYGYYNKQYSFKIFAAHSMYGVDMRGTVWKRAELKTVAAKMGVPPKAPPVKAKKTSKAAKKVAEMVAEPIVTAVGSTYVDGAEAKLGDWIKSTKGPSFLGKIIGWPDQKLHPGLVFATDNEGHQKIVKLKTHKKVDGPSEESSLGGYTVVGDQSIPNAYVDIKFSDGKTPLVGQKVIAGKPGDAPVEGIVNHLNVKQGWVYILTDEGKLVSKTFSVTKVVEEPNLIWDLDEAQATAAALITNVDKKPKKPKAGKIGYPGPDGALVDQPQDVKDAWLAAHPNRKLTKDGYAPKVGMLVRNKEGDLAVITEVATEWDTNPNSLTIAKIGPDIPGKKYKASTTSIEIDHEAELTGPSKTPLVGVIGAVVVQSSNAELGAVYEPPVGTVIYRVKGKIGHYWKDGKYRQVTDWTFVAFEPGSSSLKHIGKNNYGSIFISNKHTANVFKNSPPIQMEKVAVVVDDPDAPALTLNPYKFNTWDQEKNHPTTAFFTGEGKQWGIDSSKDSGIEATPAPAPEPPPHVSILAKKGPTGTEWEGVAVVHHDDGTSTGKNTPYFFSESAAIEAAKAMVAEDPDYFAPKVAVVDDTDIVVPEPPEEIDEPDVAPVDPSVPDITATETEEGWTGKITATDATGYVTTELTDVFSTEEQALAAADAIVGTKFEPAPPPKVATPLNTLTPPPAPVAVKEPETIYPALPVATGTGADLLKGQPSVLAGSSAMSVADSVKTMLDKKDSTEAGTGNYYGMADSDLIEDMMFRQNIQIINGQEYLVTRARLREDLTEEMADKVLSAGQSTQLGAWKLKGMKFANDLQVGDLMNVYLSGHTGFLKPGQNNPDTPNARVVSKPKRLGKSTVNTSYDLYRVSVEMSDGSVGEVDMELRPTMSINTYEWDHQAIPKTSAATLKLTPTAAQAGWVHEGRMTMPGYVGQVMVDDTGKSDLGNSMIGKNGDHWGFMGGYSVNGNGGFRFTRKLDNGTKIEWNTAHSTEGGIGNDTTRRAVISGEVRILTPLTDGVGEDQILQSVSTALEHVGVPVEKQAPPDNATMARYALQKFVANYHPGYTYRASLVTGPDDKRVVETLEHMNKELGKYIQDGPVTIEDVRLHTHSNGRVSVVLSPRVGKAIAKRQGNKFFTHSGASGVVERVFSSPNNGIKATDERWSLGIFTTGQSSHSDMTIGSGDRVYMRASQNMNFPEGYAIFNAAVMDTSTEIYNNQHNNSDNFGRRGGQNKFMTTGGHVESMHKRAIDVEQITFYISSNPGPYIKKIKENGVTHIGGRPIEEIVVTAEKAKELWTEDLGLDVFENDIPITELLGAAPAAGVAA